MRRSFFVLNLLNLLLFSNGDRFSRAYADAALAANTFAGLVRVALAVLHCEYRGRTSVYTLLATITLVNINLNRIHVVTSLYIILHEYIYP